MSYTTPNKVSLSQLTASNHVSASAFYGDGSNLTNIAAGGLTSVSTAGNITGSGISGNPVGIKPDPQFNTVTASYFVGDGSNLTNISASAITTVNYLDFNTNIDPAFNIGRLHYGSASGDLEFDLANDGTTLNIGQQLIVKVKNNISPPTTLSKGKVVKVSGSQGSSDVLYVITASWENDPGSANTIGLLMTELTTGQVGYVILEGVLQGLDTSMYTAGQMLYLSSSGNMTGSAPTPPNHSVRIGHVARVHENVGSIFVRVQNGYEIDELHDVLINNPQLYDLLMRDSDGLWKNTKTLSGSYNFVGNNIFEGNNGFFGGVYIIESFTNGDQCAATGDYSHAEGIMCSATTSGSHAEGYVTTTYGNYSHAEGIGCSAFQSGSHAEGYYTIASASYQHVQGKYNQTSSTALMLVGNGTGASSNERKNILEVYNDRLVISGSISASVGNSFSGSFAGDGSGLTNIPASSVNLSSYVTNTAATASLAFLTASNTFTADQRINNGRLEISSSADANILNASNGGDCYITLNDGTQTVVLGTSINHPNAAYKPPFIGSSTNHDFVIRSNSTERMRFSSAGQITSSTDIFPNASNTYKLGDSTKTWSSVHGSDVYSEQFWAGTSAGQYSGEVYLGNYFVVLPNPPVFRRWKIKNFEYLSFQYGDSSNNSFTEAGYINDDTTANQIDFTGQHRCQTNTISNIDNYIGLIVSSAGEYSDSLDNLETKININEAIPKINLSNTRNDKKVFGIISDKEDTESREYSTGRFVSVYPKNSEDNRIIVNSLGEGAIWVTNINGNLENGDYITSCEIPGYGMKQDDDLLHNYTVAKITCDCTFDLNSTVYKCEEFEFNGAVYKRAFVGCTYHCG